MQARLSIYEIRGDRIDEAVTGFRDAIGTIAQMSGLSEAFFLVNRDAERGVALTLWENHEAMAASRVTASRLRGEVAKAVEGNILSVEEFEIAMHEKGPVQVASA